MLVASAHEGFYRALPDDHRVAEIITELLTEGNEYARQFDHRVTVTLPYGDPMMMLSLRDSSIGKA